MSNLSKSHVSTNQSRVFHATTERQSNARGKEPLLNIDQFKANFEEKRAQLVYDFQSKNLNPNRLKATDYRFNKSTHLPKPQDADSELKHEIRKSESLKTFNKVMNGNLAKMAKIRSLRASNHSKNGLRMGSWLFVNLTRVPNCAYSQKINILILENNIAKKTSKFPRLMW